MSARAKAVVIRLARWGDDEPSGFVVLDGNTAQVLRYEEMEHDVLAHFPRALFSPLPVHVDDHELERWATFERNRKGRRS